MIHIGAAITRTRILIIPLSATRCGIRHIVIMATTDMAGMTITGGINTIAIIDQTIEIMIVMRMEMGTTIVAGTKAGTGDIETMPARLTLMVTMIHHGIKEATQAMILTGVAIVEMARMVGLQQIHGQPVRERPAGKVEHPLHSRFPMHQLVVIQPEEWKFAVAKAGNPE